MSKIELKTSEQWFTEMAEEGFIIMDPDGWDRTNYQYSFYEEKISHSEYLGRVIQSTCLRTIQK
jgi:hypothetical protein|tara:strand:- start:12044 stop:12235 length:192 start_codon:yes stop_codon:yes gene_type:complete